MIVEYVLVFGPINEIEISRSSSKGGVEPAKVGEGFEVFRQITLVYIDFVPCPPWALWQGHGISIFDLQSIVGRGSWAKLVLSFAHVG